MEISVGEVAKRSGVKVSALHFYEQKGLISSWRNQGNQRRYHRSVLRRVAVIKAAQQVGLSLEEIKHALDELPKHQAPNKEQWEVMASHWHEQLEQKDSKTQSLTKRFGWMHWLRMFVVRNLRTAKPRRCVRQRSLRF